jgi:hypothetical protein
VLLAAHVASIDRLADPRYATEPKTHVIWHEVLIGLIGSSPELQRLYIGEVPGPAFPDSHAYAAVVRDLNARHDKSSPIAFMHDGRIDLDASINENEYERLKRAMVFKIITEHPYATVMGIINKYVIQAGFYARFAAVGWTSAGWAALIVAVGAILWLMMTTGESLPAGTIWGWAAGPVMMLAFSTAPVVIEPSPLSVGTLLCFVVAGCAGATLLVAAAVRRMRPVTASADRGRAPQQCVAGKRS